MNEILLSIKLVAIVAILTNIAVLIAYVVYFVFSSVYRTNKSAKSLSKTELEMLERHNEHYLKENKELRTHLRMMEDLQKSTLDDAKDQLNEKLEIKKAFDQTCSEIKYLKSELYLIKCANSDLQSRINHAKKIKHDPIKDTGQYMIKKGCTYPQFTKGETYQKGTTKPFNDHFIMLVGDDKCQYMISKAHVVCI